MSEKAGSIDQDANKPASASDLSAQAIERFKAKDYDAAVRLFEEAYAIDKVPNYLFNIGRVYEEKGDIRAAVDHYQRFVKEPGVEIEARDLALQRLRVLKGILQETDGEGGQGDGTQAGDTAKPADQTPAPKTVPSDSAPDPKWRKMKLAGAGVLGVGAVTMIVGGILGGVALQKQGELDDNHDFNARQDLIAQGNTLALTTDVLIGVGGAFVLTGAILLGVGVAKGRSKTVASRRVWPTGLGIAGRF